MAEIDDWVSPQKTGPVDDWVAPASSGYPAHGPGADVRAAYGAVSPYIPEYLKESARSLYEGARNSAQSFSRDLDAPTLEGASGAAITALGAPIRSVTAGQAGFGTAIDAVMNPLTLNQWGDRAERYYDSVEQRFSRENEGTVGPIKAAMEGSLNLPYGLTGTGAFRPGEAAAKTEPAYAVFDRYLEEAQKTGQAVGAKLRENAAYGDADFVPRLLNHPDPNVAAIGQGFRDAAPDFASVKSGVANGDIHHSWGTDLDNMKRAAETIADFKNRGVSVEDYLDAEYYRNPNTDHNFNANLRFIDSISKAYTPEEMGEVIKSQAQNALLGGARPAPWHIEPPAARTMGSPDQLISGVRARAGQSIFEADPDWIRQATAHDPSERSYAGQALDSLQPYNLDPHAHDATVQVMRQFEGRMPPGVKIGVLNRVEPTTDPNVVKGLVTDAPDFSNYIRRDAVHRSAAMWDPDTRAIAVSRYGTSGFQSLDDFSHGVESEIVHELGHAVSAFHLSSSERGALLRDANNIGILDLPFNLYAGLKLGRPASRFASERSMADTYGEIYRDRPASEQQHLMEEEKIAVMTELYHRDAIDPRDLSPTSRGVLEKITKGGFARRASQAEPAQNVVLSHEDYRSRAPADVQHFRQLPFENEPDWHNPVDLLKERTAREDRLARYADQAHPAVLSRWRDELNTINNMANTLPTNVRAAAESHLRNNWQSYFDRLPQGWTP